ncbi:1853_t:CDS:10 [Ambispora gerdemannii]|uniref:Sister chromatid cohesion protein n=1 Tax=Ambispora gerdemannii TaxID=144530 RepID=A0A9N8W1D7_9GLOM|nr:1853_t:CDS:10 [Ambispora gerdemannii]
MNNSRGSSGENFTGEGSGGGSFIPAPTDLRSAIQYTALASITPASTVIGDLPTLSVAFKEYPTCNLNDPQYAHIGAMLSQQNNGHIDLGLQQQFQTVRGLLNQVDVSYVRFKSPPTSTNSLPSFDYPTSPPPSIPQKRPFHDAMNFSNNTHGNSNHQSNFYHQNTYDGSRMITAMQSRDYRESSPNDVSQQQYHEKVGILSSHVSQQMNNSTSTPQAIRSNSPRIIIESVAPQQTLICPDDYNSASPGYQNSDLSSRDLYKDNQSYISSSYTPAILENNSISQKSAEFDIRNLDQQKYVKANNQNRNNFSTPQQNIQMNVTEFRPPSPRVVIETNDIPPNTLYHKSEIDQVSNKNMDETLPPSYKKEKQRRPSPEVVVEIPPREILNEYRSPHSSVSEWGGSPSVGKRRSSQDLRKQREKDREDERNGESALNRLVQFLSTIFEAEDSILPESIAESTGSSSTSLFIPSTLASHEPLLTTHTIRQLVKFVNKARRSRKLEEAEVEDLARILKILERSVRDAETLDILPNSAINHFGASTSKSHKNAEIMDINSEAFEDDNMDIDSKINQTEAKIEKIINGIDAAICALSIMTGGKLSKQLYPEDLIVSSLNLTKNQLNGIIYKLLELNPSNDELNSQNDIEVSERQLASLLPMITNFLQRLYDLMQQEELSDNVVITVGFIAVGPFFVDTMNSNATAILGSGGLDGVKLVALGLLRSIFTNHQKQRTWILEEILTSLIKLPTAKRNLRQYRLPDGKSIQMISALILQLIQSCTACLGDNKIRLAEEERDVENKEIDGFSTELQKFGRAWKSGMDAASANAGYVFKFLLARCTKTIKNSNESDYRLLLDNFMEDVLTVLNYPEWPAAELVLRIFSIIMIGYIDDKKADTYTKSMAIDYLGTIAGRIKKFSNSDSTLSEKNYEADFDENDTNITKRFKEIPKEKIDSLTQLTLIENLWGYQRKVLNFLELGAMEDPGLQCARQFYLSDWGYSYANVLLSLKRDPHSPKSFNDFDENEISDNEKENFLINLVQEYWNMTCEEDTKQILEYRQQSPERSEVLLVVELLATRQALYQSFDSILSRILLSLNQGVVAFRTKALRALGQVVVNDPSVLSQTEVRNTIAQRLQDNSPAVRDAAIDLVGRYLAQKPEITEQYYQIISERIKDTGLNVRKRVIKLLRDIYLKSTDQSVMIDIGCKILLRINDEDDHVKDLAFKTIQELWLTPFKYQKNVIIDAEDLEDDEGQSEFFNMSLIGKKEVLTRSLLIVGVAGKLGERNGHILGSLFKKILEKEGKQKREVLNICQCMVDCLFEHLLTLQDGNSKTEVVSCISTIGLLSHASPSLVRRHVVTLQPYLKGASTNEDQAIMYYVLLIYRSVLPLLKRPNPTFLSDVETALLSLLTKSPQKILQEVVPCLCIIADKLTHNYVRLTKLLRSCLDKLKSERKTFEQTQELSSARNVMVLLMIIGLLCQNFDFDKKRAEKPDELKELNSINKGMITPLVYELVLYFCNETLSESVQKMALQSLGFIFLSYPIMMLRPESTDLMDRIFNSGVMDMKIQLMKVFLDFLLAEQQKINADLEDKKSKKDTTVDLKVLIGNADEFAEAGVSSSLMQRYLDRILDCTFDLNPHMKIVALDVLANIIQQGLAHPVLCMPTIVAMETSPEPAFRDKAFKLHQHLNEKHASLIHTRHVECVKKAYHFQKQLVGDASIVGYTTSSTEGQQQPEALLNPMYSLLKEKRQRRNDFLTTLVRTFDFDLKRTDESKVDVHFCKFVTENLATIDYKTIEEVLQVIYSINRVLSVVGISIHHSLQNDGTDEIITDNVRIIIDNSMNPEITQHELLDPSLLMMDVDRLTENASDLASHMSTEEMFSPMQKEEMDDDQEYHDTKSINHGDKETILPRQYAAKISICMVILMFLKEHLKRAYALSDAKCQNFNPAQSGSHKDKPALRHQNAPSLISWGNLPFVDKPMNTDEDIAQQCELFLKLMAEDGTQKDEFAEVDLDAVEDMNQKGNNNIYVNIDFDNSALSSFDAITRASNSNSSRGKGVVRKTGSSSKAKTSTKSGPRKRNTTTELGSKKGKKKRKSIIQINDTEDDDSDFHI